MYLKSNFLVLVVMGVAGRRNMVVNESLSQTAMVNFIAGTSREPIKRSRPLCGVFT